MHLPTPAQMPLPPKPPDPNENINTMVISVTSTILVDIPYNNILPIDFPHTHHNTTQHTIHLSQSNQPHKQSFSQSSTHKQSFSPTSLSSSQSSVPHSQLFSQTLSSYSPTSGSYSLSSNQSINYSNYELKNADANNPYVPNISSPFNSNKVNSHPNQIHYNNHQPHQQSSSPSLNEYHLKSNHFRNHIGSQHSSLSQRRNFIGNNK